MPHVPSRRRTGVALLVFTLLAACGGDDTSDPAPVDGPLYALGSVVIQPDGRRTTYVQTLSSLDATRIDNHRAVEIPGNGTMLVHDGHVFVGLAEEPTLVRYTPDDAGVLREDGRISFLNQGLARAGFGNVMVSPTLAYMVSETAYAAIAWDPSAMEIRGRIDLSALKQPGLDAEFWTVTHRDGRVYVPVRYANWTSGVIDQSVTVVIIDAATDQIIATARDTRCHSGGRTVFAPSGDAYVLADGRNWSAQLFATLAKAPLPPTCLLRIRAGATRFDPDFKVDIASLTGGHDAAGELDTAADGSGIAFAKMFHQDQLPASVKIDGDFAFWNAPAFKLWRIQLGDQPTAAPVDGLPFGALAWEGSAADDALFVGESPDNQDARVYQVDPATGTATAKFEMEGTFYGLRRLR